MKTFDFTLHSKNRMQERGINMNAIAWSSDVFHKLGVWDDSGDRLTLDTGSENFVSLVKSTSVQCQQLQQKIRKNRKTETDEIEDYLTRKCYKLLKKFYKAIRHLEHKGKINLVLTPEDVLVTIFCNNKRTKKNVSYHRDAIE